MSDNLADSTQFAGSDLPLSIQLTSPNGLNIQGAQVTFYLVRQGQVIRTVENSSFLRSNESASTLNLETVIQSDYADGISLPNRLRYYLKVVTTSGVDYIDESFVGSFTIKDPSR